MNQKFDLVARFRVFLDPAFHDKYSIERKHLQHEIVIKMLNGSMLENREGSSGWLMFTAGPVGAGKSSTIEWLRGKCIDFNEAVIVDIETIRKQLPESISMDPVTVEASQKESWCIAELCVLVAMYFGRNVIVDGSMVSVSWQLQCVKQLKEYHPRTMTILMHVTASETDIRQRLLRSGRHIPEDILLASLKLRHIQSYLSFQPMVDCLLGVTNETHREPLLSHPWHLTWNKLFDLLRQPAESLITECNTAAVMTLATEESLLIVASDSSNMPPLKYVHGSDFEASVKDRLPPQLEQLSSLKLSKVKSRSVDTIECNAIGVDHAVAWAKDDPDITFDVEYDEGIDDTDTIETIDMNTLDHTFRRQTMAAESTASAAAMVTHTCEDLLILSEDSSRSGGSDAQENGDTALSLLLALGALDIKETKVKAYSNKLCPTDRISAFMSQGSGEVSVNNSGSFLAYSYDSLRHYRDPAQVHPPQKANKKEKGEGIEDVHNYLSAADSSDGSSSEVSGKRPNSDMTATGSTASTAEGHMVMITSPNDGRDNHGAAHSYRHNDEEDSLYSEISLVSQLFSNLKADIASLLTTMTSDIDATSTNSSTADGNRVVEKRGSSHRKAKKKNYFIYATYPPHKTSSAGWTSLKSANVGLCDGKSAVNDRQCRRRLNSKGNAGTVSKSNATPYNTYHSAMADATFTTSSLLQQQPVRGKRKRVPSKRRVDLKGQCLRELEKTTPNQLSVWSRRTI